jgi:dihydrolipoamide dehydrogenase
MTENKNHELVIIGAGPGGYRAAFMAADLGLNVTLIDPKLNPGGVCLYHGCIPTKALLYLSSVIKDAEGVAEMGIKFPAPEIDVKKAVAWKNKVVRKLTGGLGQLVKARKINYIRGTASFIDAQTLEVKPEDGEKKKISFKNAIIATGATAIKLPGINYESPRIMDAEEALKLEDIPEKLLIIGGGYIGVELSIIFNEFGSKVSVVEMTDNFLPDLDDDLVTEHRKAGKNIYEEILLQTSVVNIEEKNDLLEVTFQDKQKEKFTKTYNKVLVAIGMKPNTEGLNLENIKIEADDQGFIKVNELQQTSVKGIYAIGDVAGPPLLAHKASYEGRVAAEAVAGKNTANDARAIPAAIYTEPGIATCGLTENEAKEKNIKYKVVKFPWVASGRAVSMNESKGFTKLLIDPDNERILGAGIVGKNAGDLIAELVVAIEMGATAEDVALSIHPHPTLSETIMEAAELFYGHAAHRKS